MTSGEGELVPEATLARPYGWVFCYQNRAYLRDPTKTSLVYAGNAPLLVTKDLEIRVLGTALPTEDYLTAFEESLPVGWRQGRVEEPVW